MICQKEYLPVSFDEEDIALHVGSLCVRTIRRGRAVRGW